MIHHLTQTYPSLHMPAKIHSLDDRIFTQKYFTACFQCNFCHDSCCAHGADIDVLNVERIRAVETELYSYEMPATEHWFHSPVIYDAEFPGSYYTRTSVQQDRCVFLDTQGRGCLLHRYALENGRDYHELKPIVCSLFPITFGDGLLSLSEELEDASLACAGTGLSAYRGNRKELTYYFGEAFTVELDLLEKNILGRLPR